MPDWMRTDTELARPTRSVVLIVLAVYVVLAGTVVIARYRHWDWTLGWTYVGLFVAASSIFKASFFFWNPDLAWRRADIFSETKTWDRVFMAALGTDLIAILIVAVRHFDPYIDELGPHGSLWLTGLALFTGGWMILTWSSFANPFFETMVRIQTDQGHRVMDKGPYSIVRHPGYVGFIATFLATALMLPSNWIYLLSLTAVLLLVFRTALEDRMLQAELPGYTDYAARVRFRLVPGIW